MWEIFSYLLKHDGRSPLTDRRLSLHDEGNRKKYTWCCIQRVKGLLLWIKHLFVVSSGGSRISQIGDANAHSKGGAGVTKLLFGQIFKID